MQVECPVCKHTFNPSPGPYTPKRICYECKKPMGKTDKWHFRPDGRIQHRFCDNPQEYHAKR